MSKKVLVVGAGPGGLTSAMLLAHAGLDVTVLERRSQVGGRTSFFEQDGYRFDVGPTFFMYPRILEEVYRAVGKDLWTEVPMERLDPQYRVVFEHGGELRATPDAGEMERRVAALSPADEGAFSRFMRDNRTKMARLQPALENPFSGWRDLWNGSLRGIIPALRPGRSLKTELARYFDDPRLQLAFSFQSKYLGMSPASCPAEFSILSFIEYEWGVWHPMGGTAQVTRSMGRVAEELGARIHLDEPVHELLFEGDRVVGARTDRGEYRADAVVMNADFAHAMQHLVPEHRRPRWNDRKIDRARFSCSTFMLYLGVEGRYDELDHHTVFVPGDYERNLREIEHEHVLSANPSVYVQNASVTDPGLAPEGHSTLYVLVPVTHQHGNVDWSREKAAFRDRVIRQLEKVGITGLEERIRFEKVVTPDDWESEFAVHRGAVFNLAHNLGQMAHMRPRNRFADVPGMYLVGGGTHPGSGLPVIFEGARISSRLLLEDLDRARKERAA
jgi:phytoene desaturase